jgi:hypothetical protein
MLLLKSIGLKDSIIYKFIKEYSIDRIKEVINQSKKQTTSTNPAGFVRKALEEEYVFDITQKFVAEKKEIAEKQNLLFEQKTAAKNKLEAFINNQVDSWIEENKVQYQNILEEKKNRILEKSPSMKNSEILARSMAKAFVKENILGL